MNILDIKVEPYLVCDYFMDFQVDLLFVLKSKWFIKWIDSLQFEWDPEDLLHQLFAGGNLIFRVRFDRTGIITYIEIVQKGKSSFCCVKVAEEYWPEVIKMIQKHSLEKRKGNFRRG